jgi:hypothetical protein
MNSVPHSRTRRVRWAMHMRRHQLESIAMQAMPLWDTMLQTYSRTSAAPLVANSGGPPRQCAFRARHAAKRRLQNRRPRTCTSATSAIHTAHEPRTLPATRVGYAHIAGLVAADYAFCTSDITHTRRRLRFPAPAASFLAIFSTTLVHALSFMQRPHE